MTLGKIGCRKLLSNTTSGWQPPKDWPDIRRILADDVTPQAAIDAGATKKWIMLCNPGPPGGAYPDYTFNNAYIKYLRISDGHTTIEQSSNIVAPLSTGKFWIIVYTTDSQSCRLPLPENEAAVGILWVYAPNHTGYRATNHWAQQIRIRSITVKDWEATSTGLNFYNCPVLEEIKTMTPHSPMVVTGSVFAINQCQNIKWLDCSAWNTSGATSLTNLFAQASQLTSIDVSGWDVSNVTTMNNAFSSCNSLRGLDLSGWDTSKVTNMGSMFSGCTSLRSLDLSGWDTSKVTSMTYMFNECRSLEQIRGISEWDVTSVTSMFAMFQQCTSLDSLDLSGWNTTSLTAMNNFINVDTLRYLDMSNWDASNVTNISYSFNDRNLIELKLPTDQAKGPRIDISFSGSPGLSHDSLVNIIAWVADLNSLGLPGKTLTLGNTNKAKLTADEIAVATAKGWTVS